MKAVGSYSTMRCVHCGKPLGRFRKATGEFCSEEHRDQYRDQIERAALERLLLSREKLLSSHKPPVAPTIVAELLPPTLSPRRALESPLDIQPYCAATVYRFPSSSGNVKRTCLPTAVRILPGPPAPVIQSLRRAPVSPLGTTALRVQLPLNGRKPSSLKFGFVSIFGNSRSGRPLDSTMRFIRYSRRT
jgi:hypothetical protein